MKIILGGVGKTQVRDLLEPLLRKQDEVIVGDDMAAAMKLRSGQVDYYLGTCHTGAGASLGVLVGLLGGEKCHTFGRSIPSRTSVDQALSGGAVALGFSVDQIVEAVPVIFEALVRKNEE